MEMTARLHSLTDFIEFAAGITGVEPKEILNSIKEMVVKKRRETTIGAGYKLVLDERELRLEGRSGVIAVYARKRRG